MRARESRGQLPRINEKKTKEKKISREVQVHFPLVVGRARENLNAILKSRGQQTNKPSSSHGPGMKRINRIETFVSLLEKPWSERLPEDILYLMEALRELHTFKELNIVSSHMEEQLAKIVDVRKFVHRGGIVVREGQQVDCLYQHKAVKNSEALSSEGGKVILFANIVEAIQIAALDPSGTSDPYVVVRVGTREGQTEVKYKTLNPIWEQTLKIEVEDDADSVELTVWDYDAWGDHDFLGLVEVPLRALQTDMHKFHKYALPLKDDERYSGLVDEHMSGKAEAVSGSITFFLQLTTDKYLDRVETLMSDENQVERSVQKLLMGSIIGVESFLSKGSYDMTVIVDQPAILLRVQLKEYESHIKPLQDNMHTRKLNFFRELSVFHDASDDKLNMIASSFDILQYRSGVIARERETWSRVVFIMSGEVNIYKSVLDNRAHNQRHQPSQRPSNKSTSSGNTSDLASSDLSKVLMDKDVFLSRLLRGHTIHLLEVLSKTPNAYTSVAATPVELLVSKGSTQIGMQHELVELNDNWNSEPKGVVRARDALPVGDVSSAVV
ncbi:hypothetical protein GUITHDRAFT_162018 [Guillardia theta CCMP2712]|uniref:C2 domain-containing protein n=1 Tax=Guillardia theta (strain CCMP2712) TaxID=905079 RepID=L1JNK8_GUITC|nr:hypothetical protein GUITHDRAFT_162018 [Guillardia theta CCMP2712]EKX50042.1 hypothetical protein GUITHDRAFT_162018 [Guillardia theta CCMP2712]|eukprot:XP_005837022.1 hypothetical protein GUITHDRAFT_162018 [Guillardia theta CCMP2712]